MKKTFISIVTLLIASPLSAQYYQDAVNRDMLRKFFDGAVTAHATTSSATSKQVILTNNSSVDWWLCSADGDISLLKGDSSIIIKFSTTKPNIFTIQNAWCGEDKQLVYEFKAE